MNGYTRRRADRVINVQTFGTENAADLPAGSRPIALFAALGTLLPDLIDARAGQLRGPVAKQALLDELIADFKAIARTARAIAHDDPAFSAASYLRPEKITEIPTATHASPRPASTVI
jgi:hypothetical protein